MDNKTSKSIPQTYIYILGTRTSWRLGCEVLQRSRTPYKCRRNALINLVNTLKICSNHQRHQKNGEKKDTCLNMDCFRITCVRDFLSTISEAADMSGNYLWRSELSDQSLLITNFSAHQNRHLPWLALSRHSDEIEIAVQTHSVAKAYLSRCLNTSLSCCFLCIQQEDSLSLD